MKLCTSTLKVISYSAFMECICLAEKSGLRKEDFIQIVEKGVAGCFLYSKAGSSESSSEIMCLLYTYVHTNLKLVCYQYLVFVESSSMYGGYFQLIGIFCPINLQLCISTYVHT